MRTLRHALFASLAYFFVLELALVGAIEFWPDVRDNLGGLKLFTQMKVLRGLLGVLKEGELPGYIVFQHFFKGNLLCGAVAILFAVGAVAGEVHRGTLEVWLARPVSRTRLLLERYVTGALQVVVPFLLATWTIPALLTRWDEEIALAPLMLGAVHMSCMLLAVYGTTFFFSTVGRNPIRIALAVSFFCIFQLAIYLVMEVTHWSLVRLVDPRLFIKIFSTGELNWRICGGLLAYTALTLAASVFAFRRRLP